MKYLEPNVLFAYAVEFSKKSVSDGLGSQYPTFSEVARKFRVKLQDVQDSIDDFKNENQDNRYMDAIVGIGNANGTYAFTKLGEYRVEAYN